MGVLLTLGFQKHLCYPAAVHQYLSPNDNRLHGTAKQSWRMSGIDTKDDVESCLYLLARLDYATCSYSQHWFDQNMLSLKKSDLESMIGAAGRKFSDLHKSWLHVYRVWMGMDPNGDSLPVDDLYDALDA